MPLSNVIFRNGEGDHEATSATVPTVSDFTTGDGVDGVNYFSSIADGAIAKGDVVYFTAGKVKTYSDLTEVRRAAGIAAAAAVDGASVKVLKDQNFLLTALTGATVGKRQWWTGSGHSETAPVGAGKHQIQSGYASSTTTLFIDVQLIDKNNS